MPMVADLVRLLTMSLFERKHREGLVDVGRSIRRTAFDVSDTFPQRSFRDVIVAIGGDDGVPVLLPEPRDLMDNTIGGIIPYYYIGSLTMALKPKTILEIGTYLGASTLTMALNAPEDATIYTVDLPDTPSSEALRTLTQGDRKIVDVAMRSGVGAAFQNHPLKKKIVQIRADSRTLDVAKITNGVDFIVIDGGHSYDLIKNDTERCLPSLSKNGVILWDDYCWNLRGVCSYLNELAMDMPLWRIAGTQYVIHSPLLG